MIRGAPTGGSGDAAGDAAALVLEMALIRLTEIRHLPSVQGILDQLATLETRLAGRQRGASRPPVLPLFDRPTASPAPQPDRAGAASASHHTAGAAPPGSPAGRNDATDAAAPPVDMASEWDATVAA